MTIESLRKEIDAINRDLIHLVSKRISVAKEIAVIKKQQDLPILDPVREKAQREEIMRLSQEVGLKPKVMEEVFAVLVAYAREEQL